MGEIMKKFSIFILIIILTTCSVLLLAGCSYTPDTAVVRYEHDSDILRVGVISDSQLVDTGTQTNVYEDNLLKSLKILKNRKVNMILFAGDITDKSNAKAYDIYVNAVNSVYGDTPVIIQSIMGNHDYWGNGTAANCRKLYEEKLGESPWTHYVVGRYHFIGASPVTGSMDNGYAELSRWLKKHIEIAIKEDPNRPIFVMTHNSPKDTVYGSDDWGDKSLYDVFKNYEQVVNISGHLHYSMLDERAIHQQDFTSITTQSVSYTELEEGKINGTIPPNAAITPMGYIIDIYNDNIEISRINFGINTAGDGKEEKANMRWHIPIPVKKANFTYTVAARLNNNTAPMMNTQTTVNIIEKNGKQYLQFIAGADDDFVHSYKLVWNTGKDQYYFSDFYNGIDNMSPTVELPIDKKRGIYDLKIYAIDSWNAISSNFIAINNVIIK